MADVYSYRLKKNYQYILRDLEPPQVINYLYQEDVIDSDVRDEIREKKPRKQQAEALLTFLERRGPEAIQQLVAALEQSSQKHLAKVLNTPLANETSVSSSFSGSSSPVDNNKEYYPMQHVPCGVALIINNYIFDNKTGLEFREGADLDATKIAKVFQKLKFTTYLKSNMNSTEMKALIRKYSQEDHTHFDSFVLFIMTHGKEGGIFATDGVLLRIHEDITKKFNPQNCPTLADKPKLFFIQACRGTEPDIGVDVVDGPVPTGTVPRPVPGTGTDPRPVPGTGTDPGPVPGTGTVPRPVPGTGTDPRPVSGTGSVPRPVPGTGTVPGPVPGTGTVPRPVLTGTVSKPLTTGTVSKPVPSENKFCEQSTPCAVPPFVDTFTTSSTRSSGQTCNLMLPSDTDIFIAFASSPSRSALRNTVRGGWFVSALCDVITKYADKEDLMSMMTKVNGIVNGMETCISGDQIAMQSPEQHNRLRKKLYFNVMNPT